MFASAANVIAAACSDSGNPSDILKPIAVVPVFDYATFGPREHIENLHPHNRRGTGGLREGVVVFAQRVPGREKEWQEWTVPAGSAAIAEAERLIQQDNRTDIYVSQAAFVHRRLISQVKVIGACYVDLDYHKKSRWKAQKPADVAAAVVAHLDDANVPLPSYILSTGRGLVCVWLHELIPARALRRWNPVQKRLGEVLEPFGADKQALDAARVFRLVGSRNSRAERSRDTVCMVWCQGSPEAPTRHVFGTLADEVFDLTQAELFSIRAERAKRRAEGKDKTRPATRCTAESYWENVFADLERLRAYRCPDGELPDGQRDTWLFIAAVALSWISPPEVLRHKALRLAGEAAGWRESETRSRMSAVIKRAHKSAAGETMTYNGKQIDCRYRMKASTIIDWLAISAEEQQGAGLRVLVDRQRKTELAAERTEKSRRRKGVKARTEQQSARLEMGGMALYLQATKGLKRDELAERFGVSSGQMAKAMREARSRDSAQS